MLHIGCADLSLPLLAHTPASSQAQGVLEGWYNKQKREEEEEAAKGERGVEVRVQACQAVTTQQQPLLEGCAT